MLTEDIAHIIITFFTWETGAEVEVILQSLKEKNTKKVILDLRNNPGGVIYSAIEVAQKFAKEGRICIIEYQDGTKEDFDSDLKELEFETIVLINSVTASAAELLASAIKESESGLLIGHNTYGKNSIQKITFTDEGIIKSTVGKYLTREGKDISLQGIEPHIFIYNATSPSNFDNQTQIEKKDLYDEDKQLKYAIQLLTSK